MISYYFIIIYARFSYDKYIQYEQECGELNVYLVVHSFVIITTVPIIYSAQCSHYNKLL